LHGEGSARKRIFTMFGGGQSPAAGRQLLIFLIDVLLLELLKLFLFCGFIVEIKKGCSFFLFMFKVNVS
jgi:hypothetical protein